MTTRVGDLREQVEEFSNEVATLLHSTLPGMPPQIVDTIFLNARYVIRVGVNGAGVPLFVHGDEIATLKASVSCRLDSVNRYLAVDESKYSILANLDRTPILRFEYSRSMLSAPNAHVHVHAHRGALSHLLSRTGHEAPHDISFLHIPVGGSRFRPCLEDLVQFVIQECRFDHLQGWQDQVDEGRERWRRRQVAAVVRDAHDEAARVLQELGYTVESPADAPAVSRKALRHW